MSGAKSGDDQAASLPPRIVRRSIRLHSLIWLDKAATWQLARDLGGEALVELIIENTHTCYQGDRTMRHEWGFGCGTCDACRLRHEGWVRYASAGSAGRISVA
jgi:7-cyano-7-deazaguanine synthase